MSTKLNIENDAPYELAEATLNEEGTKPIFRKHVNANMEIYAATLRCNITSDVKKKWEGGRHR
jgi:hypothetical protein